MQSPEGLKDSPFNLECKTGFVNQLWTGVYINKCFDFTQVKRRNKVIQETDLPNLTEQLQQGPVEDLKPVLQQDQPKDQLITEGVRDKKRTKAPGQFEKQCDVPTGSQCGDFKAGDLHTG